MSAVNPFGDEIASMEKFSHHFKIGDRVVLKEGRRPGKISNLDAHNHVHVELDSGHLIQCTPYEVQPEDWQRTAPRSASEKAFAKSYSPFPIFDDDEPEKLDAELEAAGVSVHDAVLIKRCAENIRNAQVVVNPFGNSDEDESITNLRVTLGKYEKRDRAQEPELPWEEVKQFCDALASGSV